MDNYLFQREIGRDKEGVCWGGGGGLTKEVQLA